MSKIYATGFYKAATSAQANQALINRGLWDCTVQAVNDQVVIGVLPAGHRIVPQLWKLFFNALVPAMTVSLCVGNDLTKLIASQAIAASTAAVYGPADNAATYVLAEQIGVDYDNDREIYLLIEAGAATAPVGAKVIGTFASFAASTPD